MRSVVDSVLCSVEEAQTNFIPLSISAAHNTCVPKVGAAQLFRVKVGVTVSTFTSVLGVVEFVAVTMPTAAFRINFLALELLTLTVTGSPVQLDVALLYGTKQVAAKANLGSFSGTTYPTTTAKRWVTMRENPGSDAGTGGTGNDGYFIGTGGDEALFYGGIYLGESFTIHLAHSAATGVANGTMNLHIAGHYLG